uniref:Retrotransposon gag domain-containing protein n=1 Tax=Manihot esculenta TaxID=3983 RepID=A0A2C9WEK4_MANES
MSVAIHFTKLKKLWDELSVLKPLPTCECEASRAFIERENEENIMQFLMGLNDSYDHVKNQILIMDPLPSVNKAYSMVLQVEKQRQVNGQFNNEGGKNFKKRDFNRREERHCDFCKNSGHIKDTNFNLHGYPN